MSKVLKTGDNIEKIYHLSDIHIRNDDKRRNEYIRVFNRTCKKIKKDKRDCKSVIVVTGDVVHNKTVLRPTCIDLTALFFKKLLKITDVVVIPGNHDCNISNPTSMNALYPIIKYVKNNVTGDNHIYLLPEDGVYQYCNIDFGYTSIFSESITKPHNTDRIKVALYHGTLNGSKIDNGFDINGKHSCKDFIGWDYVLLGDIHKFQYLNKNKTIAYPSSLIQQNYGESLNDHGFIVWDIAKGESKFIQVNNDYGFVTFKYSNGECINKPSYVPKFARIRISYSEMKRSDVDDIVKNIRSRYTIDEVIVCRDIDFTSIGNYLNNEDDNSGDRKEGAIEMLLEQCRKSKLVNKDDSVKLISVVEKIIQDLDVDDVVSKKLSLKSLKFDNLFGYGEKNSILFDNWNKIVGVVAKNGYGKSSLVDSILYSLYDKFSSGDRTDVVNVKKNVGHSQIEFNLDNSDYLIKRGIKVSGVKRKRRNYEISVIKNEIDITEDGKALSNKQVEEEVCSYQDLVDTAIVLQNSVPFTDLDDKRKKEYVYRVFNLELFDKIYRKARYKCNSYTQQLSVYRRELSRLEDKFDKVELLKLLTEKDKISQIGKYSMSRQYPNTSLNELLDMRKKYGGIKPPIENTPTPEQYNSIKNKVENLTKEVDTLTESISCISYKKSFLDSCIDTLKESIESLQIEIVKARKLHKHLTYRIHKRENKIQVTKSLLEGLNKKYDVMNDGKYNPNCDVCILNMKQLKTIQEEVNIQTNRLVKLERRLINSKLKLSKISDLDKKETSYLNFKESCNNCENNLKKVCFDLSEKQNRLKNAKTELEDSRNILERFTSSIKSNTEYNNAVLLDKEIALIKEFGEEVSPDRFEEIKSRIAVLKERMMELERLREEVKKLEEDKGWFELVCKVMDKEGFIASIMNDKILKKVQSFSNQILGEVAGFYIVIRYDGGGIKICKRIPGGEVNSNRLSGYEKFIVNIVLKIVFNILSCRLKTDFIIIDEGFSSCDQENVNRLKPLYEFIRRRFKWCLLVSHIEAISENFDQLVTIDRIEDNSSYYSRIIS